MAKIGRRRLAKELVRMINDKSQSQSELIRQTAAYLVQNRQVGQSHLLVNEIASELLASGHAFARITSANALSDGSRKQIIELLKKTTGANSVELDEHVDASLIGGVIVRTPDMQLDASVASRIKQIAGGIK